MKILSVNAGDFSKRVIELVPYIFFMAGDNSSRVSGDGGFRWEHPFLLFLKWREIILSVLVETEASVGNTRFFYFLF